MESSRESALYWLLLFVEKRDRTVACETGGVINGRAVKKRKKEKKEKKE